MARRFKARGYNWTELMRTKAKVLGMDRGQLLKPREAALTPMQNKIPFVQKWSTVSKEVKQHVKDSWPVITTDKVLGTLNDKSLLQSYTRNKNLRDLLVHNDISNYKDSPLSIPNEESDLHMCSDNNVMRPDLPYDVSKNRYIQLQYVRYRTHNDMVKKEVGDITILINNAGIVSGKKFIDLPDALLEKTMQVNTMAHFWTYKAFLPAMMASNHGHLVSIASSAGLIGVNGLADYCTSKFAAIGFAESVGLEMLALGKTGVKTTIVCPYFINTGMADGCSTKWPQLMPILEPEYASKKIVDAILKEQVYLVMPRSLYIIFAFKNIISAKLGVVLGDYIGAFHFMDHFKGHGKKD
ncbi:epidermal retinol dehydrogenase 2-like [Pseudophryne corroboree]|uniref:epidermal retinol dehydrogenase 2-like n=1 Tax=Pseudophryne corroboree TaxID=495146 RepID=UPI003081EFFC